MNTSLLKVLIERGVIQVRTEIDATYRGTDIAGNSFVSARGTFLILSVERSDLGYTFTCADTIDGKRRRIAGSAITAVDGMDPLRLAANYDLDADGNPIKVGKRRGRKPRARTEIHA